MDNGWVKLYRSMTSCKTASRGLNFFGAMAWLVAKASYEETWHDGDKIKRGQLFTGRKFLSKEWRISQQSVRTILQHLETDGFLTIKSTSKGSVLTICNYSSYQVLPSPNQPSDQPTGNQRVTNDQPTINHYQEYKEVQEVKEISLACAREGLSEISDSQKKTATAAERIWNAYPRRLDMQSEIAAVIAAIQKEADKPGENVESAIVRIGAAVKRYAEAVAGWPKTDKRFVAQCRRWFEESRYLDDPETWVRKTGGGKFDPRDQSTWEN